MKNKIIAVIVVTIDITLLIALIMTVGSHSRDELCLYTHSWILKNPEITGRNDYHSTLTFYGSQKNITNVYYFARNCRRYVDGSFCLAGQRMTIKIGKKVYHLRFKWQKRYESFFLINCRGQKFLYATK